MPDTAAMPAWRTAGVLPSRFGAYLIDLIVIGFFCLIASVFVFVLGILTFGLAWGLFAVLVPGIGILYSAITVGGPRRSTLGMRLFGLAVVRFDGGRVDGITAAVHALFFYVAAGTVVLWLLDILIGLI